MILLPAIDLIGGCAVRLQKGDYAKKTVYSSDPAAVARGFAAAGAKHLHIVDLDGAKSGTTDNYDTVRSIVRESGLCTEIGGGIRSLATIERYLEAGVSRVILGTAAVTDEAFLQAAFDRYGGKVAVGVDIKDGYVAIHGWTEVTNYSCEQFFAKMQAMGVANIICTDISKDGMLGGTNLALYRDLATAFAVDLTASGGVSSVEDIRALREIGVYGAILGKALYTGALSLEDALAAAKEGAL